MSSIAIAGNLGATYSERHRREIASAMRDKGINDPYSWLESSRSWRVRRWIAEQNAISREFLDSIGSRSSIRSRLQELEDMDRAHVLHPAQFLLQSGKQRYFQMRHNPGDEFDVLYYRDGIDGESKVAFDSNRLGRKGELALHSYFPNDDGTMLAYTISRGGSDVTTIGIVDLEGGYVLRDRIENVSFGSIQWMRDSTGFFYSKWPDPANHKDPRRFNHVYFHELESHQRYDTGVFGKGLGAGYSCYVDSDTDRRYLIINVSDNVDNDIYYKRLSRSYEPRALITGKEAGFYIIDIRDGVAYVLTDYEAPNFRVIKFDIHRPSERNWTTVIKECDDVIDSVSIERRRLIVNYLKDVHSEMDVYTLGGRFVNEVRLPFKGHVSDLMIDQVSDYGILSLSSFVEQTRSYKVNLRTYELARMSEGRSSIYTGNLRMEQIFYRSKDGTVVPMFIVGRKGVELDGKNPTLLYGYGGFQLSSEPKFDRRIVPFLNDGGIFAVANIRGGGEYGSTWYDEGRHKNKQNSFDDFLAAAEWLIENGYTSSDRLAIRGRSNGGLLVAAAMVQRPDLFKAVVCEMPAIDMWKSDLYDIGALVKKEYGDPRNPEDLEFILKYSPYHNIRMGERYPSLLVITGENDTRAHPMHGRKFVAKIQEASSSGNPVLMLTQMGVGHGGQDFAVPMSKNMDWQADWWAFVYKELGMDADMARSSNFSELRRVA
ncbi:MAG: S9 family peptidase [Candidatus Micrarchaeota archaeon]|nr:S9 family peptidase [Candidatus Micrarchaeota archaeon]